MEIVTEWKERIEKGNLLTATLFLLQLQTLHVLYWQSVHCGKQGPFHSSTQDRFFISTLPSATAIVACIISSIVFVLKCTILGQKVSFVLE